MKNLIIPTLMMFTVGCLGQKVIYEPDFIRTESTDLVFSGGKDSELGLEFEKVVSVTVYTVDAKNSKDAPNDIMLFFNLNRVVHNKPFLVNVELGMSDGSKMQVYADPTQFDDGTTLNLLMRISPEEIRTLLNQNLVSIEIYLSGRSAMNEYGKRFIKPDLVYKVSKQDEVKKHLRRLIAATKEKWNN